MRPRRLALALLAMMSGAAAPYSLDEAADRGMVDLAWTTPDDPQPNLHLIQHLGEINPGIVNRFAAFWGGPTQARIDHAIWLGSQIHAQLPRALLGFQVPESVAPDYAATLNCDGKPRTFSVAALSAGDVQQADARWLDISKPAVTEFYICVGQAFIDGGFTLMHFEAPALVLSHAAARGGAEDAYRKVRAALSAYARRHGSPLYFSGDEALSAIMPLDAVYEPSRFFHTIEMFRRYQNKVDNPGVGVGYYYALSPAIIRHYRSVVPSRTKVFFYVDNWDPAQDDLRRLMELDPVNRRLLITRSAENARAGGAYFVPSLNHCDGCVKPDAVRDKCEMLPGGTAQYDALACGDVPTIAAALRSTGSQAEIAPH